VDVALESASVGFEEDEGVEGRDLEGLVFTGLRVSSELRFGIEEVIVGD
jgi:hypothetical protein